MLDFVKRAFHDSLEVVLWIILILSVVAGGIAGNLLGGLIGDGVGIAFLGAIIGFVIGLLTDIIMGGFVATILNMDKNLEEIRNSQGNMPSGEKTEARL